ncbi:MAG: IclR family transcriptional regulator [Chloroflexota bacterium]
MRDARTLQSLHRGLQVLEMLTKAELGPTDLARSVGVDRATVHRILHTLAERGFVERVAASGRYRANLRHLFALTGEMAATQGSNWLTLARSYLEELNSTTSLSANFAVSSNDEVVYLMQVLGEGLSVHRPPGTRRPLYCSAIGKALLGSLPEREMDRVLATLDMQPHTPNTITSPEQLKKQLQEYRAKGYYVDNGEYNPRIRCIAATVLDQFGRPIASVGVSGPIDDPTYKEDQIGPHVADVARRMSAALGFRSS